MTQEELTQQLNAQAAQAAKIANETRSLLDKITELLAIIGAGQNVTPELQAAADAVGAQLNIVDALVPDAP